jgi:hypothetical protein
MSKCMSLLALDNHQIISRLDEVALSHQNPGHNPLDRTGDFKLHLVRLDPQLHQTRQHVLVESQESKTYQSITDLNGVTLCHGATPAPPR